MDGQPEGSYTSMFEIICCYCGDHPIGTTARSARLSADPQALPDRGGRGSIREAPQAAPQLTGDSPVRAPEYTWIRGLYRKDGRTAMAEKTAKRMAELIKPLRVKPGAKVNLAAAGRPPAAGRPGHPPGAGVPPSGGSRRRPPGTSRTALTG